ncbi:hypothetical protein BpHYR1_012814, partial [Brachionus plicatilis]
IIINYLYLRTKKRLILIVGLAKCLSVHEFHVFVRSRNWKQKFNFNLDFSRCTECLSNSLTFWMKLDHGCPGSVLTKNFNRELNES